MLRFILFMTTRSEGASEGDKEMLMNTGSEDAFEDKENVAPRAPGRPAGARNKARVLKEARRASAQVAREAKVALRDERRRTFAGPSTRGFEAGTSTAAATISMPPPPPRNSGERLTNADIMIGLRVVHACLEEAHARVPVTPAYAFERASVYTGIGRTKLIELWGEYADTGGRRLPLVRDGKNGARAQQVPRELIPELKEFVHHLRVVKGKVVEVPDIVRWLRDSHGILVSRENLRKTMHRAGFVWGRTHKIAIRREDPRVVAKRNEYLCAMHAIDNEIAARSADINNAALVGPRRRQLIKVFVDESYANVNHSLGYSWYHKDDDLGNARNVPSGKGRRLVLLAGITEEFGMLGLGANNELIDSIENVKDAAVVAGTIAPGLMIFEARKCRGDYHANMDSEMFCRWASKQLMPEVERLDVDIILVMDNASYHTTPADGCIMPTSWKKKKDATDFLDEHGIEYRPGVAPKGDSLIQLKAIAEEWLRVHAKERNIKTSEMRINEVLGTRGRIVFTPPYMPELQPIEELWRSVKGFVAREFVGTRTMPQLWQHVLEGFVRYGGVSRCKKLVARARAWEERYRTETVYGIAPACEGNKEEEEELDPELDGVNAEMEDDDEEDVMEEV